MENRPDLAELDGALDLWACMWRSEEQESFETAVVRTLIDAHPARTRLLALGLCHVIGTQRLLAAAARIAERGVFSAAEIRFIEEATLPRYRLQDAASRLRGNVLAVEHLLARVVTGQAAANEDALLDWIDLRDLVAVARTTLDARLFGEIERRIARRGKYQRGRAANVLGFRVARDEKSASGEWGSRRSIFGG
ncbi:MAG TPA: hypothetical protein VFF06_34130 [Polyangia bacterium]|nr:hypothetical protein [Polyangia bacterium]